VILVNYQLSIGKKCALFTDDRFSKFFSKTLGAFVDQAADLKIKSQILVFLGSCFLNMDFENVKSEVLRLVGIGTLCKVDDHTRQLYFEDIPELEEVWHKTTLNFDNIKKQSTKERVEFERTFMFMVLKSTLEAMDLSEDQPIRDDLLLFLEQSLDLMLKIITQMPSRRFFNLILKDSLFFLRAKESLLLKRLISKKENNSQIKLLQLLDLLEFYSYFAIDESSGLAYSKAEIHRMHYDRIKQLQKFCFQSLKEQTIDFALSNVGAVDSPDTLSRILSEIELSALVEMSFQLGVRTTDLNGEDVEKSFLIQSLIYHLKKKDMDRIDRMRNDALYPDEKIIFDDSVTTNNAHPVGLTCLSLRYLSVSDYLYRQYNLLKFEYAYRLREDVLDASQRLAPIGNRDAKNFISTSFQGIARMAVPVERLNIVEKGNPMLGHVAPSFVKAHIIFSLSHFQKHIADEWDMLASNDVLYLLSYNAANISQINDEDDFLQKVNHKFGLKHVRACKVIGWLGYNGEVLKDGIYNESRSQDRSTGSLGSSRTLLVDLDPNQYILDQNMKKKKGSGDFYESFNVIMRRRANDNTWSSLLKPFRDVVGFENLIPDWLKAAFLGHEDPSRVCYKNIENLNLTMNFRDTFVDIDHIKACFPNSVSSKILNR
jgi:intron-binding protein aquarius